MKLKEDCNYNASLFFAIYQYNFAAFVTICRAKAGI